MTARMRPRRHQQRHQRLQQQLLGVRVMTRPWYSAYYMVWAGFPAAAHPGLTAGRSSGGTGPQNWGLPASILQRR